MNYIFSKLLGYLRLMRPANIVTAITDILAGIAISGFLLAAGPGNTDTVNGDMQTILQILCLVFATIGLYGGGVVFNDVFDASLDRIERPERPIPSGIISRTEAIVLGVYLLVLGILAAFSVGELPGAIALGIAVSALVYNKWGKHNNLLGPLNMGLCRGLNLLLGMSIIPDALLEFGWLAIVPIIYIASITMISRDEVHGGSKRPLMLAAVGYGLVVAAILALAFYNHHLIDVIPFLCIFIFVISKPLIKAINEPIGPNIGKAVRGGIIGLVAMNAAWAGAFTQDFTFPFLIICLMPVSIAMSKAFAVT